MKRYKATLTVVLDFWAKDEDEARYVLQEMEYSFDRPPNKEEMDSEIIDEEIKEIDKNL